VKGLLFGLIGMLLVRARHCAGMIDEKLPEVFSDFWIYQDIRRSERAEQFYIAIWIVGLQFRNQVANFHHSLRALLARIAELVNGGSPKGFCEVLG
jgi:hypothetical protein